MLSAGGGFSARNHVSLQILNDMRSNRKFWNHMGLMKLPTAMWGSERSNLQTRKCERTQTKRQRQTEQELLYLMNPQQNHAATLCELAEVPRRSPHEREVSLQSLSSKDYPVNGNTYARSAHRPIPMPAHLPCSGIAPSSFREQPHGTPFSGVNRNTGHPTLVSNVLHLSFHRGLQEVSCSFCCQHRLNSCPRHGKLTGRKSRQREAGTGICLSFFGHSCTKGLGAGKTAKYCMPVSIIVLYV